MTLLTKRFKGHGLYILDEPEAALSPTRQLAFLARMRALVNLQSQFIVATHSPIIMAYPGARILMLESNGIREVAAFSTTAARCWKNSSKVDRASANRDGGGLPCGSDDHVELCHGLCSHVARDRYGRARLEAVAIIDEEEATGGR
jgi:energy-coupling factor transporter ATP-binding protein EcfA2